MFALKGDGGYAKTTVVRADLSSVYTERGTLTMKDIAENRYLLRESGTYVSMPQVYGLESCRIHAFSSAFVSRLFVRIPSLITNLFVSWYEIFEMVLFLNAVLMLVSNSISRGAK